MFKTVPTLQRLVARVLKSKLKDLESEFEGTHIIKILKNELQDEQNEAQKNFWQSLSQSPLLDIYARNYNFLRVMSGMGILSYSS